MAVGAKDVKALRERTGAAMMDCKAALEEAAGDIDKAIEVLRVKGQASAEKRSGRATSEGTVASYIHAGGSPGVLVEVQCETDFVARTDDFQSLVRDVAKHNAAADTRFVRREEVTTEALDRAKAIYPDQAAATGPPPAGVEQLVAAKLEKVYGESGRRETGSESARSPNARRSASVSERSLSSGEVACAFT